MIKNNKKFFPPEGNGKDFKEVFLYLASVGAGRPVDKDGFCLGPWTPDLLADAISQIDGNQAGIELRTVQLWFQDNEKGISTENVRWLARIFGCDDPEATSAWQAELSASLSRLAAKRRERRRSNENVAQLASDGAQLVKNNSQTRTRDEGEPQSRAATSRHSVRLAIRSEALFSRGSPLDLPASVFAGVVALGFLSYLFGIHNVTAERANGLVKQVGFVWAPNWTLLFMVFMPLFLAFVVEIIAYWKNEARSKIVAPTGQSEKEVSWLRMVEASSLTYWAVFVIFLLFAGLFQWIGIRLLPLLRGGSDIAPDWGSLAITHPEIISVPETVLFTGLAYLYMSTCFYLFFVGLILLYTMTHDLWKIVDTSKYRSKMDFQGVVGEVGNKLMRGIFRCTILGVLIAICMKLQTIYLSSSGGNIVAWLVGDMSSVLRGQEKIDHMFHDSMPTHFSSLLVAISTCVVFLYGAIRLGGGGALVKMSGVVVLLGSSYLLIGVFSGFSVLLSIAVLISIYGLFDPGFGRMRTSELGIKQSVP